jgi:hypothetical protein
MTELEERILIYTALALLCAVGGIFAGGAAAAWTFVQVAAVIEIIFGLAGQLDGETTDDSPVNG